jgi:hypothetical protein
MVSNCSEAGHARFGFSVRAWLPLAGITDLRGDTSMTFITRAIAIFGAILRQWNHVVRPHTTEVGTSLGLRSPQIGRTERECRCAKSVNNSQ